MNTPKPDPDEPYRYACPDCGTVVVRRLLKPSIGSREDNWVGGVGVQARKEKLKHRYTCNECEWRGKKVYDRKRDGMSKPWK